MGEVKVKVKLTNPFDKAMVREGVKKSEEIRTLEAVALVDEGAVQCVLPQHIVDALGLKGVHRQTVQYADGRSDIVDVVEPVLMEIIGRKTYEECLVLGDEVLIGQTALEKTDLHVDCRNRSILPNPAHPNQPIIKVRGFAS
jgi:clan AA aspartic protease